MHSNSSGDHCYLGVCLLPFFDALGASSETNGATTAVRQAASKIHQTTPTRCIKKLWIMDTAQINNRNRLTTQLQSTRKDDKQKSFRMKALLQITRIFGPINKRNCSQPARLTGAGPTRIRAMLGSFKLIDFV